MTTAKRTERVLASVGYPGYTFYVSRINVDAALLYALFEAPDNDNPSVMKTNMTRQWVVTSDMTDGAIVQTALKCVLTSIEHEAREQFTYKGARVFDPHFNIEDLVSLRT